MKLIELKATDEKIDMKRNTLTYVTDFNSNEDKGIILIADQTGERDLIIANPVHNGGEVSVIFKPIRAPAKKFNVGEVVAYLAIMD